MKLWRLGSVIPVKQPQLHSLQAYRQCLVKIAQHWHWNHFACQIKFGTKWQWIWQYVANACAMAGGPLDSLTLLKCCFKNSLLMVKRRPLSVPFCFSLLKDLSGSIRVEFQALGLKQNESKQCWFSIYIFDNSKSKSMVRFVTAKKMVLCGLVFARKIARMILIQNM